MYLRARDFEICARVAENGCSSSMPKTACVEQQYTTQCALVVHVSFTLTARLGWSGDGKAGGGGGYGGEQVADVEGVGDERDA